MTQDDRIWILMSRRLSGEASPADGEELRQLLAQSPDRQYLFSILHSYFSNPPVDATSLSGETDPGLEARFRRIVDARGEKARSVVRRFPFRRTIGYAAAISALLVLAWGIYRSTPGNEEVQARAGARTHLRLPDGTQVWLNSNSKLKYANDFNIRNRDVTLEGEAYFDVAKDKTHPFIVRTATLEIRALGTSFAVRSYPQDETIETTLLKGSIEVSRNGSGDAARVILKPNEKLVCTKVRATPIAGQNPTGMAVNTIRPNIPDSAKTETAWMYNRLVFDGDNFRGLADKMERWYDVHIIVMDGELNHYRFGGVFANESIEEALKELQLTARFNYKINGKEIELYERK